MKTFVTICVSAMLTALEMICGNMGLALGLPVYAAIYFGAAFGLSYGVCAAGIAGLLLDVAYDRTWLFSPLLYIGVMLFTCQTISRSARQMPGSPLAAGGICGALLLCGVLARTYICRTALPGPDILSLAVFQISGGSIFMLAITAMFDAVNFRSDLPRFCRRDTGRNFSGGQLP